MRNLVPSAETSNVLQLPVCPGAKFGYPESNNGRGAENSKIVPWPERPPDDPAEAAPFHVEEFLAVRAPPGKGSAAAGHLPLAASGRKRLHVDFRSACLIRGVGEPSPVWWNLRMCLAEPGLEERRRFWSPDTRNAHTSRPPFAASTSEQRRAGRRHAHRHLHESDSKSSSSRPVPLEGFRSKPHLLFRRDPNTNCVPSADQSGCAFSCGRVKGQPRQLAPSASMTQMSPPVPSWR